MPAIPKLNLIPASIRTRLEQRLRDQGYGGIEETTAWLREQGIDVGKTTIGAYAQRLKRASELDLGSLGLNPVGIVRVRLQCVQIAATAGGEDLLTLAEQVLAWAVEPVVSAARPVAASTGSDDQDDD